VLVRLPRSRVRSQGQAAAHPEVHRERRAAIDVDPEVLAAPPQAEDPAAGEPARELPRLERLPQRWHADLHALDATPREPRLQAATQDFDLGELRHGRGL